ncbi:MAG: DUF932 domain-containing protein [Thermoplasmata archaeon]
MFETDQPTRSIHRFDPAQTIVSAAEIPHFSLVPVHGPDGETLEGYRGVVRDDTGRIVSVVSDRYALVQHRTIAEAVHAVGAGQGPVIPEPGAPTFPREQVRLYAGGRRLEAKIVLGRRYPLGAGESFYPGLRILNSLDGSWAVRVEAYAVRLACANQLYPGHGLIGEFRELHLTSASDLVGLVEKAIHGLLERFPRVLELYARAMDEHLLATEVEPLLLARGIPRRHAAAIGGEAEALASHNTLMTRWSAYNVATRYLTHRLVVNPDRERAFERAAAGALLVPAPLPSNPSGP